MTAPINSGYGFERYTLPSALDRAQQPDKTKATPGENFAEQVKSFVSEVDGLQKTADAKADQFASGKSNDIHGTMISVEQAEISLRLIANVRNRVVEMYREVMRMGS